MTVRPWLVPLVLCALGPRAGVGWGVAHGPRGAARALLGSDGTAGLPEVPIDTFTTPNGLFVIVSETHEASVAAVSVWYRVGASPEQPHANALAHLVQHLAWGRTENLSAGEMDRLIAGVGGARFADTDADRVAFTQVVPSDRVNLALWIEAERMSRLVISEPDVAVQVGRLTAERNRVLRGGPYRMARLTLDTLSTDYGPYKRATGLAGLLPDSVDAASARAFYGRYFAPDNAVLAVAGDVDPVEVRALVKKSFGDAARARSRPPRPDGPVGPRTDGERRGRLTDAFASDRLFSVAFNVPEGGHSDQEALALLARVLGGGRASRLRRTLVYERGLARDLTVTLNRRVGPGTLAVHALVADGVPVSRLETVLASELERLTVEPLEARELRAALNQWKTAEMVARLGVRSRVEALQRHVLYHGDPFRINEESARFERITTEDIRRVAERYLRAENRTVLVTAPVGVGLDGAGS